MKTLLLAILYILIFCASSYADTHTVSGDCSAAAVNAAMLQKGILLM